MANTASSFTIRPAATPADGELIVGLVRGLAAYEHLAGPDDAAATRLIEHGFGSQPPMFEALLAIDESVTDQPGGAIGYSLCFPTYSTFLGKPTWYLEDLFVLPAHRGRGVGKALLERCITMAKERGCGRMEWAVLDWNTSAQAFYESLGARRLSEWHSYRLDLP